MDQMQRNRYPRMAHDYYETRVRGIFEERERTIAGLKTRKDALNYVGKVRTAVKKLKKQASDFKDALDNAKKSKKK